MTNAKWDDEQQSLFPKKKKGEDEQIFAQFSTMILSFSKIFTNIRAKQTSN